MPAKGTADSNPTPGTLKLTQQIDSKDDKDSAGRDIEKPKGILKGRGSELTEEECCYLCIV